MAKPENVKKLPEIFQTETERKFFEATFDQVFSKKNSERLTGFIGRREGGKYDPIDDFYLSENTKNRTWWQLEPVSYSVNSDTLEKENQFFYEDMIDRIGFLGGETSNHDRLFNSQFYSFAPPINIDMFINYQNYYWLPTKLPIMQILGMSLSDIENLILDSKHFNTSQVNDVTPNNLEFSSGMRVTFPDVPEYSGEYTIEDVGKDTNIKLFEDRTDILPVQEFEFLPWDSKIELSVEIVDNSKWDNFEWDARTKDPDADYITISRGAFDRNAWSRTNTWYHIDVVNQVLQITNNSWPSNAQRARRPIIEFVRNIELLNSGINFFANVNYLVDSLNPIASEESGEDVRYSFYDVNGKSYNDVIKIPELSNVLNGNLLLFKDDNTVVSEFNNVISKDRVWVANITNDLVLLTEYVSENLGRSETKSYDIVLIVSGRTPAESTTDDPTHLGETYFKIADGWAYSVNQKTRSNQPPLYALYDYNMESLNAYPSSTFTGSEIFSYALDDDVTADLDPILGLPIVYKDLGQISDIMFENDLITQRASYISGNEFIEIPGYYYYHTIQTVEEDNDRNTWTFDNSWYTNEKSSDQRVIDRSVVSYDTQYQFIISVSPVDELAANMEVLINGKLLNTSDYIYTTVNEFHVMELLDPYKSSTKLHDVVEVYTTTTELLSEDDRGYWEIPSQLELNPEQQEIGFYSIGEFTPQFTSIINNQDNFEGSSLGQSNNYRDTNRDLSLGTNMIHNISPLLKTMFISSHEDVEIIASTRYARQEYINFKNKFLKIGKQLIDRGFDPILGIGELSIDRWMEEILNVITVSKEFSDSFAYSYMIARGTVYTTFNRVLFDGNNEGNIDIINIQTDIDPTENSNFMYVYNVTDDREDLLLVDVNYEYTYNDGVLSLLFKTGSTGIEIDDEISIRLYDDPSPAYVPCTPAKMGMSEIDIPRLDYDTSYSEPTSVIVGHDGSRTVTFGQYDSNGLPIQEDFRDNLLLAFERRVYNGILGKFRNDYNIVLTEADIKEGFYRKAPANLPVGEKHNAHVQYTLDEYIDVTKSHFSKWTAINKASMRVNNFYDPDPNQWKTWNYSSQLGADGKNLPGYWRGIYDYYYDCQEPHLRPWEMLGFNVEPEWWFNAYSGDFSNGSPLWIDIQAGNILFGNRAGIDERYARPNIIADDLIPVDGAGNLRSAYSLFDLNPFIKWEGIEDDWKYGDGAPVEEAWKRSSEYYFSLMEFYYLMKPSDFGELFWNTDATSLDMGNQFVDNTTHFRPTNSSQHIHGELIDGKRIVNHGYQQYITDRLLFLGKDVTHEFGDKIRSLSVNLGYKVAGFTNKDSLRLSLTGVSASTDTSTLLIPTNNYDVYLYKGSSIEDFSYSGVIIRALEDGTYSVHGYDLFNMEFKIIPRMLTSSAVQITQGGTPADYKDFTFGETYRVGNIVRYNTRFYQAIETHEAEIFNSNFWALLPSLPEVGGVSVGYIKTGQPNTVDTVKYGTVFNDIQEVFNFLISYGDYLESRGWVFEYINAGNNLIENWLNAGKQFLFWVTNSWAPGNALFLSPGSTTMTLNVDRGYPDSVEKLSNGVYSILNVEGTSVHPRDTTINRKDQLIQVLPKSESDGVYFLKVSAKETEHIVLIDNITSFNDTVYDPVLGVRQMRLKWNGVKTGNWFGKLEAEGYLVQDDTIIQNYDNIVESLRSYYNTEDFLDNVQLEEAAKHLIGYENKSYLDNLDIADDVQFNFYQGFIREKGTLNAVSKLLRSDVISSGQDNTTLYEEWAFRVGEFGGLCEQMTLEFLINFDEVNSNPQAIRLNYVPSEVGSVSSIEIFNAIELYNTTPLITISPPTGDVDAPINATAVAVLGDDKRISEILLTDPGYGYDGPPNVTITHVPLSGLAQPPSPDPGNPEAYDKLYAIFQPDIIVDTPLDDIIEVDIDDREKFLLRPNSCEMPFTVPKTDIINYQIPNAGYVHTDDVDWQLFNHEAVFDIWDEDDHPDSGQLIHIANNCQEDWGVYELIDNGGITGLSSGTAALSALSSITDYELSIRILGTSLSIDSNTLLGEITKTRIKIAELEDTITVAESEKDGLENQLRQNQDAMDVTNSSINESTRQLTELAIKTQLSCSEKKGVATDPELLNECEYWKNEVIARSVELAAEASRVSEGTTNGDVAGAKTRLDEAKTNYKNCLESCGSTDDAMNDDMVAASNDTFGLQDDLLNQAVNADNIINGVSDTDGSISEEGIVQKNQTIIESNQELIQAERLLDQQVAQLESILNNIVSQEDLDNANAILQNEVAVITIDNSAYGTANTLVKSRRYFCSRFETTGAIASGFLRINIDEDFDRVYNFEALDLENISTVYILKDRNGDNIVYDDEFGDVNVSSAVFQQLVNYRFKDRAERTKYGSIDTLTWIDTVDGKWSVEYDDNTVWRSQESLVNSMLYENSIIREKTNGDTITRLPIYDPFKDILPGIAEQNIEWKTSSDPARYTNSDNPALIDLSNEFGVDQVGELWLDLSSFNYLYYEQSKSTDETNTDIMDYRRNNWGKLFPGSIVNVYEWVESDAVPAQWDLDGTPKNDTDYVVKTTLDTFTGNTVTRYYFWVNLRITKPNKSNRTLSANGVRNVIVNPRSQGYEWFASIQGTNVDNTVVVGNVDNIISNRNTVLQINYQSRLNANKDHTQWTLLSEGNPFSKIPDSLWDKMVNSLVGYSEPVPVSSFPRALSNDGITGVLPIPDTFLSEDEKYGIGIRPQQSMFVDRQAARKIFVQASNALLGDIKLWITNPEWYSNVTSQIYWSTVDWYETGYDVSNTKTSKQVLNLQELEDLKPRLNDSELVKVFDPQFDEFYEIYEFIATDNNFILVCRQSGTIKFLDTMFTDFNRTSLRREIRELSTALKDEIFTGDEEVDVNLLFFAMVNFVFSEQSTIDWVFKTTYVSLIQDGIELTQSQTITPDVTDEFIDYIEEAKPYHTKLRDRIKTFKFGIETATGPAYDDAIGNFISHCVDDVSIDECNENRLSWHYDYGSFNPATNEWDGNTITENLRYMKISIEFNRHYCSEEKQLAYWNTFDDIAKSDMGLDINRIGRVDPNCSSKDTIIDPTGFSGGWDISPWDNNRDLSVNNSDTGYGSTVIDLDSNGWDQERSPNVIDSEGYVDQSTTPDADLVEAGSFNTANNVPEEVAPLIPTESIVIANTMSGVGVSEDSPTDKKDVAFIVNIHPMGWTEHVRLATQYSTTLREDITYDSVDIKVVDGSQLQPATKANPGVIWVDCERIEYTVNRDNVLSGITRGTLGTSIVEHAIQYQGRDISGNITKFDRGIYDGSNVQYVPSAENTVVPLDDTQPLSFINGVDDSDGITPGYSPWFKYVNGTLTANNPQGEMLTSSPGHYRDPRYIIKS